MIAPLLEKFFSRRLKISAVHCIAFVAGIIIVQQLPALSSVVGGALLLSVSAWKAPRHRGWLLPLIFAVAGAGYADVRAPS